MKDAVLVIEGRVVEIRWDAEPAKTARSPSGRAHISLDVYQVWRVRPPQPVFDWHGLLPRRGPYVTLEADRTHLAPGLCGSLSVKVVARHRNGVWQATAIDLRPDRDLGMAPARRHTMPPADGYDAIT